MNQLGSKLANSVRQAKTTETEKADVATEVKKVAVKVAKPVEVDVPLPLLPSRRRVWPD